MFEVLLYYCFLAVVLQAKGKLRMKATWAIGKGASKRGMLKVYGVSHLKSWAQEIVMLGMLRRAQHPSLIQCLWTNSSNPYYETMTLISGEIITSDSRYIHFESHYPKRKVTFFFRYKFEYILYNY